MHWTEIETSKHQDHVIAHVIGATVLGWVVAGEAAHLLLDIGFLWTIYLDGEMNLLPQGVAIAEVEVTHRPRRHGRSNYGISRTVRVILDLLTVKFLLSYSTRPLQIFGLIGFAMGAAGAAITAYLAYMRLFGNESIANRPLLTFGVLFFTTGVQLVTVGLLAELMARTYHESQGKPTYVIRDIRESPTLTAASGEYRRPDLVDTSR